LGTGNTGQYWTFDLLAGASDAVTNPIYEGSHIQDSVATLGKVRILANYYSSLAVAPTVSLVLSGQTYAMTRQLGINTKGTYSAEILSSFFTTRTGCYSYYFTATVSGTTYRLPETGFYNTVGLGSGCAINWSPLPLDPTPTPTQAPTGPPPPYPACRSNSPFASIFAAVGATVSVSTGAALENALNAALTTPTVIILEQPGTYTLTKINNVATTVCIQVLASMMP